MKRIAAIAVFIVVLAPETLAFHDLDCGPFRATVVDEATGDTRCLDPTPEAQKQFLRFRQLQQEQEKRTRDLQLQQRQRTKAQELKQQQRAKAQALIGVRELNKQQIFNRRQAVNRRQPGLAVERSATIQEGLLRQGLEAKRRSEESLESRLIRQQNLLEQQLELPRADLLDDQKAFNLRLKKDQQRQ